MSNLIQKLFSTPNYFDLPESASFQCFLTYGLENLTTKCKRSYHDYCHAFLTFYRNWNHSAQSTISTDKRAERWNPNQNACESGATHSLELLTVSGYNNFCNHVYAHVLPEEGLEGLVEECYAGRDKRVIYYCKRSVFKREGVRLSKKTRQHTVRLKVRLSSKYHKPVREIKHVMSTHWKIFVMGPENFIYSYIHLPLRLDIYKDDVSIHEDNYVTPESWKAKEMHRFSTASIRELERMNDAVLEAEEDVFKHLTSTNYLPIDLT